jgi:cytochrome b
MQKAPSGRRILVWDLPVRLFHWAIVLLVLVQWLTAEYERWDLHMPAGYAVLALVLFRICWGFVGSPTARFAAFVRGPRAVVAYARRFLVRRPGHTIGHNPMGAVSVLALLASLLVQAISGLFLLDTDTGLLSGPLAHLVSDETAWFATAVHGVSFNVLLTLIALHVLVVVFYVLWKRENLVGPMLVGSRNVPADATVPDVQPARRPVLAVLVLVACSALVWVLVTRV